MRFATFSSMLALAVAGAIASSPVLAQRAAGTNATSENPLANRNGTPPVLNFLQQQQKVKLTSLGEVGGLPGYLGQSETGQMQVFYLLPDGNHVVAGVVFKADGTNVTGIQIADLKARLANDQAALEEQRRKAEEEARALAARANAANSALSQYDDAQQAFSTSFGSAVSTGAPRPVTPSSAPAPAPVPTAAPKPVEPAPALAPVPGPISLPSAEKPRAEAPASANKAERFLSASSKEEWLAQAEKTAWFGLGREGLPIVWMVADPQCPFCHRTWKELRPKVMAGEIAVRVILIAGQESSKPRVLSILAQPNSGEAWLNGVGSEANVAVPPPPAADSAEFNRGTYYMTLNNNFAFNRKLSKTPTLAYVGRDGKFYESEGSANLEEFLGAIR